MGFLKPTESLPAWKTDLSQVRFDVVAIGLAVASTCILEQ